MTTNTNFAVAMSNKNSDIITAFVYDFPGLIVQETSLEDVDRKLKLLLASFEKRIADMQNNLVLEPVTM